MSYRLLITFVTLIISTQIVSGQNTESEQIHLEIASKILDEVRSVIIILPDSYTKSADKKYPLLILLDGAAHLEATFAAVNSDSTLESIIVAIENLDRERDFTVTKLQTRRENTMGGGWNFLSFLETEVIPKVNSEYKTSSQKMLIGHSLGGLLTLNAFMQEDSPFNAFVSIDPSIWWDEETMQKKVDNIESTCFTKKLFIATANQGEANFVRNKQRHDRFFSLIQQKANTPENSKLLYYEHENHRSIPSVAIKDGLTFLSINE